MEKRNIVITAVKPWALINAEKFIKEHQDFNVTVIKSKNELTTECLNKINPEYIFFTHWSWMIPAEIYERYDCVIFHPSDVPFGRGGSPVQNLIADGFESTVLSAIKATGELDAGDVYVKRQVSLLGGGDEIFLRLQQVIFNDMIPAILYNNIEPVPQAGEVSVFKRRTPDMSEIPRDTELVEMFNKIRMLDADGYPNAFIMYGNYKLTFSRPKLKANGIVADVCIEVV